MQTVVYMVIYLEANCSRTRGLGDGLVCLSTYLPALQVVARCARITDQWGERIPEWIETAEVVIKAGLEQVCRGCTPSRAGLGRS